MSDAQTDIARDQRRGELIHQYEMLLHLYLVLLMTNADESALVLFDHEMWPDEVSFFIPAIESQVIAAARDADGVSRGYFTNSITLEKTAKQIVAKDPEAWKGVEKWLEAQAQSQYVPNDFGHPDRWQQYLSSLKIWIQKFIMELELKKEPTT